MSAYLYIFEDGSALQSIKPPSEDEDFQEVLQGTLHVYRWNGATLEELECTEEEVKTAEDEEEPETSITAEWIAVPPRK